MQRVRDRFRSWLIRYPHVVPAILAVILAALILITIPMGWCGRVPGPPPDEPQLHGRGFYHPKDLDGLWVVELAVAR